MESVAANSKLKGKDGPSITKKLGLSMGVREDMAALTLDDRGIIYDCNRASETLFKYRRSEMVWRHVSMLLPQLANQELMQNGQPNPRLRFLCHAGRHYQAVTRNGGCFSSRLFFNCLGGMESGRISLIVRPAEEASSDGGQRAT